MKLRIATLVLCLILYFLYERSVDSVRVQGGNVPIVDVSFERVSQPMQQLLLQGRESVDSAKAPVIGFAAATIVAERPESALMNFTADALLSHARVCCGEEIDVAITNKGGLRSEINEGVITYGDIYNVYPFENNLVTLTLNGQQMLSLFDEIARVGGEAISGARMEIVCAGDSAYCGALVVGGSDVREKGDDWKLREYRIVTISYLAQGNDGLSTLAQAYDKREYGITLRQLMVDYISALQKQGKPVDANVDGRVRKIVLE